MTFILTGIMILIMVFVAICQLVNTVNVIRHLPADKRYETNNFFDNPTLFVIIQILLCYGKFFCESCVPGPIEMARMGMTELTTPYKILEALHFILLFIYIFFSFIYNIIQIKRYLKRKNGKK